MRVKAIVAPLDRISMRTAGLLQMRALFQVARIGQLLLYPERSALRRAERTFLAERKKGTTYDAFAQLTPGVQLTSVALQ